MEQASAITSRSRTAATVIILTVLYFVAAKLSLKLAYLHVSASPVWPPAGMALAAVLLLGYRVWPAIFAGAFLVNLTTAGNLFTSLGIAAGNTLEAVLGAWLIHRVAGGAQVFERAQSVFKFALVVLISTLVSPTIGLTSLALAGFADWANYSAIWLTWWLGDATGDFIVAPLLILWFTAPARRWDRAALLEVILLFLLLFFLGQLVFGGWLPITAQNYPMAFICGPIVIWTAFRFTPRETATGIFILSALAVWGTLRGHGPFAMENDNQSLLALQASTAILIVTAMALAAGMAERRRAEAAIEQQRATVEAANRTKDNFLAMLSHELRTPLTPVLAALDALKTESPPPAELKETLAMMRRNIELESQLIDDLLDLTRITKDKLQLEFEPVDAHQAISNVVEMCALEAKEKQLQMRFDLRAGDFHVMADPAKFQQIIWNLLKNAIKFTGENGTITISSTNLQPNIMTIGITDTGIGIEPDLMARIFNPFEQGERSFQRRFGGLGLGLAISKSLAQAHGASLIARSDGRDRGATFLLAIKTAGLEQAPSQPAAVSAQATRRNVRILLVDDHPDTCLALERLLTLRGHHVVAAQSVRAAMEVAESNHFDLLISDVGLPDGSGMELFRHLRAKFTMPGIAMSGFGMDSDIGKSLEAGFSAHLVKPVKLEKLEAAISRVMAD
ncbi:MAG TPA: MASE1 domain-containing protein [Chthoniobacterales bacterium]|nr:MASE1 domain-containing protein [Chthoniobacterales bacterium]